jgi:Flp pilus assembly protein TadD
VFIFFSVAGLSYGQSFKSEGWPRDASNSEIAYPKPGEFRGAGPAGTISVQELEHPLEGKGLRLLVKARDFVAQGDYMRGMEQMRAAIREPGAEPYALAMLGEEHLKHGDVDSAIAELQSAVGMLPGISAIHSNLALALGTRQRNEEALSHARKALQLDPGRAKTRFVLGQILLQMGRNTEAGFHLRIAAKEVPVAQTLLAKYFTHATQ